MSLQKFEISAKLERGQLCPRIKAANILADMAVRAPAISLVARFADISIHFEISQTKLTARKYKPTGPKFNCEREQAVTGVPRLFPAALPFPRLATCFPLRFRVHLWLNFSHVC
ncbi:MAG: hypothetical protein WBW41_00445 [Verrucomicrobiia bacterium]